ncbi:MAG: Do family serine endopeptidase [Myxococcaceae bacterium]|nr:Do family serine endopeptidase [Myxococcaceae bacterium]
MPSLAPLVEAVKGAVVNVDVTASVKNAGFGDLQFDPFADLFGRGHRFMPGPQVRQGAGSGFIIDPRGRVLTNNHVVEDAVSIRVHLDDGRAFDAKVLGRDPLTDVALLQLEGVKEDLPFVKLGDSDAMKVGDYVLAIGNPFGLASSVSSGILSARARDIHAGPYDDFLQTDAAINPGNSGGPLFNMRGEVIGINTAIIGGGNGIGFAVPSNMARALLGQLEKGVVRRGWLGVAIQDLTPQLAPALGVDVKEGAVVVQVTEDTPAAKAGLQRDDVVVAVDGQHVGSSKDLTRMIGFKQPGTATSLDILRHGQKKTVKVTLGERPDLEHRGIGSRSSDGVEQDEKTGRIGLSLRDVDPRIDGQDAPDGGAVIAQVQPGSRADDAGLKPGMVIVEAGGQKIRSARDFLKVIRNAPSGKSLLLRIAVGDALVLRALPVP